MQLARYPRFTVHHALQSPSVSIPLTLVSGTEATERRASSVTLPAAIYIVFAFAGWSRWAVIVKQT